MTSSTSASPTPRVTTRPSWSTGRTAASSASQGAPQRQGGIYAAGEPERHIAGLRIYGNLVFDVNARHEVHRGYAPGIGVRTSRMRRLQQHRLEYRREQLERQPRS